MPPQAAGGEPVSLARALLCVPCIQTGVAKALLFRMAEASLDESSALPAAVLSQFPWLDQVTDPDVLVKTLLTETFAVCSDAVKQGTPAGLACSARAVPYPPRRHSRSHHPLPA